MRDIQTSKPEHNFKIDKVGVRNLKYPLIVLDKENQHQKTIAEINTYVDLNGKFKGTHMSRFIEILNVYVEKNLTVEILDDLIKEIKKKLGSDSAYLEISFPYFIKKISPVSKKSSFLDYLCKIIHILKKNKIEHYIEVKVPITTLCPCSKEISTNGAHNQRGYVTLKVKPKKFVWFEDLISLIENEVSCEIYPLLKREDELFVTEKAYSNPKFVEDVVRGIAGQLEKDDNISWFKVECENSESIHNHNAYACIKSNLSGDKK